MYQVFWMIEANQVPPVQAEVGFTALEYETD